MGVCADGEKDMENKNVSLTDTSSRVDRASVGSLYLLAPELMMIQEALTCSKCSIGKTNMDRNSVKTECQKLVSF